MTDGQMLSKPQSDLLVAVQSNDLDLLKASIGKGADVNFK